MEYQTVQTLIRLLAVWSGSALFAYAILSETLVYEIVGYLLFIFNYYHKVIWKSSLHLVLQNPSSNCYISHLPALISYEKYSTVPL